MARISGNVVNTYVHMDLIVNETGTSTENNSSSLSWQLVGYLGSGASASHWYSNNYHTISVKINGSTVYSLPNTTEKLISIGTQHTQASPLVIASGTTTVVHNADGSKVCACQFSCVYRYDNTFSWSGSGNVTLTDIPRATTPTVSSTNVEMGKAVTISCQRASTAFTHTLTYSFGTASGTIASNVATSYSWTVPTSLASAITNAASGQCTITCTTYNGSTQVGSKTCKLNLVIPRSIPSISAGSAIIGNSVTISCQRVATNLTHTLQYYFGSDNGTIATNVGASRTWTIPSSLAGAISNASSGTCTVVCSTYNGTAFVGSSSASLILSIPATAPVLSATSVSIGDSVTITMNRIADNLTHNLTYKFVKASGTIGEGIWTTKAWETPLGLAIQIPDSVSGTCTITCKTYNGTALVGTKTVNLTLTVPPSMWPSISKITCTDPKGYLTKYGGYVQNKSTLHVVVTASGTYGSTIESYNITANGTEYIENSITTGVLKNSGTNTITVSATDSRGRTTTSTTTISVLAYSTPTISSFRAVRCNPDGTESTEGNNIKVSFVSSITPLNNNNGKSEVLSYKKSSDSIWTNANSWSWYNLDTSERFAADTEETYNIRLTVTDDFGTATKTMNVPAVFTLIDFYSTGKGVAFGKVSETNTFDVNMISEFRKSVQLDYSGSVASGDHHAVTGDAVYNAASVVSGITFGGSFDSTSSTASVYRIGRLVVLTYVLAVSSQINIDTARNGILGLPRPAVAVNAVSTAYGGGNVRMILDKNSTILSVSSSNKTALAVGASIYGTLCYIAES